MTTKMTLLLLTRPISLSLKSTAVTIERFVGVLLADSFAAVCVVKITNEEKKS